MARGGGASRQTVAVTVRNDSITLDANPTIMRPVGGRRGWLFATGICLAVVLIPATWWLLSAGERGADIANVIALPVAVLALFASVVGIVAVWGPEPAKPNPQPRRIGVWASDALGWVHRRLTAKVTLTAMLVVPLVLIGVLWGAQLADRARIWTVGCDHPTQLRMLSSTEQLEPAKELARRYGEWAAHRRYGCAVVSTYVYPVPREQARNALAGGWSGGDLRDAGPHPDVWLAASAAEVDRVRQAAKERFEADDPVVEDVAVAWSPVVLGVPAAAAPGLRLARRGQPWSELFGGPTALGWDVVRPDPTSSAAGELATAMLYGTDAAADPAHARAVEQRIGRSLDEGGYPLGDELDVLCRYRQLDPPHTAVVVSEQALARFNRGEALGGECRNVTPPRDAGDVVVAFYASDTRALQSRFVRFTWSPPAQAAQARAFGQWLAGPDGARALVAVGLRPLTAGAGDPADGHDGLLVDATFQREPMPTEALDRALGVYATSHRRGRVLFALDVSGSMAAPVGHGQGSRLDVAGRGVVRALGLMGERDEFGLWVFPDGPGGAGARETLAMGSRDEAVQGTPRRQATENVLKQVRPGGNTPLFKAIVDGVRAVGPSDDTRIGALVVLTDGEDTSSGLTAQAVGDAVRGAGVRLFVVAVGDATCATVALQDVAAGTGGRCLEADLGSVDARLAELFGTIWGQGR
jgi:Ca-activated chloride channel homolog